MCWTYLLMTGDSTLKGFNGGFTAGDYGYLCRTTAHYFGKVVRFDLATFSQVSVLDVPAVTGDSTLGLHRRLRGGRLRLPGAESKRHLLHFGKVVRFDLASFSQVSVLDVPTVTGDSTLTGFGGFAAGDYGYLVPYRNPYFGKVVRFDLSFSGGVLDVPTVTVTSVTDLKGFHGGFAAGDYGYLVPYTTAHRFWQGGALRPRLLHAGVGAGRAYGDGRLHLKGFHGGFTAGDYGYLVPYRNSAYYWQGGALDRHLLAGGDTGRDREDGDSTLKGFHGGFTAATTATWCRITTALPVWQGGALRPRHLLAGVGAGRACGDGRLHPQGLPRRLHGGRLRLPGAVYNATTPRQGCAFLPTNFSSIDLSLCKIRPRINWF